MTRGDLALEVALSDRTAWLELIHNRRRPLRQFLLWAAACEHSAPATSLRFEHREDIARCRATLHLFAQPWWGVAVYSCFDSELGTKAAASEFREPLPVARARRAVFETIAFPDRSVQNHRAQATLARARSALVSICEKARDLESVIVMAKLSFDERLDRLEALDIDGWGRTTNYDALARAGVLQVGRSAYRPGNAYLAGSTGPSNGFETVWGVQVRRGNATSCEELLRQWTREWDLVAETVEVEWTGRAYDSTDFENALCMFQERRPAGRPDPAAFASK